MHGETVKKKRTVYVYKVPWE